MHPGVYRIGSNLFGAVCVTSSNIIMRSNIKDNWIKYSIYSAAIIGYILFLRIDFHKGYFKHDIELYQSSINDKKDIFAMIYIAIFIGIIMLLKPRRWRKKLVFIKENIIVILFYGSLLGFFLLLGITDLVTDLSLVINKQKVKGEMIRTIEIGHFDYDDEELILLDREYERLKMSAETYNGLPDTTKIELRLKKGLFQIPFDPIPND